MLRSRQAEGDLSRLSGVDLSSILYRGKYRIEDWSGGPFQKPVFLNDSDGDVVPRYVDGRLCFAVQVASLKAGMAVIKLAVRPDLLGMFPGLDVLATHQFLVIWLRSNAPVIREVADDDFPSISLGDPLGDGIFNPPFSNGLVQINVTGTFPLLNNFDGNDPDDSITLPTDWAQLAAMYSFDSDREDGGVPGTAVDRWDIHDDQLETEGHVANSDCGPPAGAVEAVDNCYTGTGNDQNGPFSSIYGIVDGPRSVRAARAPRRSCRTARRMPAMPRCLRSALTCGSGPAVSVVWRRRTRTTSTSAIRRFRTDGRTTCTHRTTVP